MSKFVQTNFTSFFYAKEWPGINLGASHEYCAHPNEYVSLVGKTHSKSNEEFFDTFFFILE